MLAQIWLVGWLLILNSIVPTNNDLKDCVHVFFFQQRLTPAPILLHEYTRLLIKISKSSILFHIFITQNPNFYWNWGCTNTGMRKMSGVRGGRQSEIIRMSNILYHNKEIIGGGRLKRRGQGEEE